MSNRWVSLLSCVSPENLRDGLIVPKTASESATELRLVNPPSEAPDFRFGLDDGIAKQHSFPLASLTSVRDLVSPPGSTSNQEVAQILSGFKLESKPTSLPGDGHDFRNLRVAYPWNPSDNIQESFVDTMARHSLVFSTPGTFKLICNNEQHKGLSTGFTESSIESGLKFREQLKEKNPTIKLLSEIRYREAPVGYLPADSRWWLRDQSGQLTQGYDKKGKDFKILDFTNPQFQDHVAEQAGAAVKTGVLDGVMLDCFHDSLEHGPKFDNARTQLLTKIRATIGPDKLILVNSNESELPLKMTEQVNGYYMECATSDTPKDWAQIAKTLDYAEKHTRAPHVNIVETWIDSGDNRNNELNKMRATMTLVMTHAPDGYALFGDANPTSKVGHAHSWYQFYNTAVGAAIGGREDRADGSTTREYANGSVLYNPAGNKAVSIHFKEARKEASTGKIGSDFTVNAEDGDIFLKL